MTGHLVTQPAKLATCSRCGALTLTAITGGLTTVIDPCPLEIAQEIAALMAGKATFDLVPVGCRLFIEWRDITRMRAPRLHAVVTVHQCAGATQKPVPVPAAAPPPDEPPF